MKKTIISALISFVGFSSFQLLQQPGGQTSMQRGKKVYDSTCLACHQPDGDGVQRMNPTLVKTKWVLGDKKILIKIVLNGLKGGEIEIDGDKFHNPMPPQAALSDQKIADVLTYVRNSFGNKASAVTAPEVKKVRSTVNTVATKPIKKSTQP